MDPLPLGIGVVRDGPAAVGQNGFVLDEAPRNQIRQHWNGIFNDVEGRQRLSPAHIREGPSRMLDQAGVLDVFYGVYHVLDAPVTKNRVPVE